MGAGDVSPWKSFLAGNVGGFCGLTATHPIDTVKLRLQNPSIQRYGGVVDCLRSTVRQEGALAMYRGLLPPALGYGAINAVAFSANTTITTAIRQWKGRQELTGLEKTVCGGMSGGLSAIVRSPVERIKTVMQTSKLPNGQSPYRSDLHCITTLWRQGGIRSVFQGFHGTVWREVGQFALYFQVYDWVWGAVLQPGQTKQDVSPSWSLVAGAAAGALPWIPTYPLDVLKSRVQAAPAGSGATLLSEGQRLLANEGVAALWRGLTPALVRAAPLHGLIFTFYELTLTQLNHAFPHRPMSRRQRAPSDHTIAIDGAPM